MISKFYYLKEIQPGYILFWLEQILFPKSAYPTEGMYVPAWLRHFYFGHKIDHSSRIVNYNNNKQTGSNGQGERFPKIEQLSKIVYSSWTCPSTFAWSLLH